MTDGATKLKSVIKPLFDDVMATLTTQIENENAKLVAIMMKQSGEITVLQNELQALRGELKSTTKQQQFSGDREASRIIVSYKPIPENLFDPNDSPDCD